MRTISTTNNGSFYRWLIFCPGCKETHEMNEGWSFNGDHKIPTFKPSILVKYTTGENYVKMVCHSFVTDGKIQFLRDSTHKLAGQTVDLPDIFSASGGDYTEIAEKLLKRT